MQFSGLSCEIILTRQFEIAVAGLKYVRVSPKRYFTSVVRSRGKGPFDGEVPPELLCPGR